MQTLEREDSPNNVPEHANNIKSLSLAFRQEGSTMTVHIFQPFSIEKAGIHDPLINSMLTVVFECCYRSTTVLESEKIT